MPDATSRALVSSAPPAGTGTTMVTVRDGNACARASTGMAGTAATVAASFRNCRRRSVIVFPFADIRAIIARSAPLREPRTLHAAFLPDHRRHQPRARSQETTRCARLRDSRRTCSSRWRFSRSTTRRAAPARSCAACICACTPAATSTPRAQRARRHADPSTAARAVHGRRHRRRPPRQNARQGDHRKGPGEEARQRIRKGDRLCCGPIKTTATTAAPRHG